MRRLLVLTGAIVLVDTMFFTALTPLLPHYVHRLDLGKGGAGVLQAMYPAGALLAAIPGGIAAARFGVKPTVLTGLSLLALTTTAFGLADSVWTLDLARFLQGVSSAFSWTGALAWLVAASPPGRRGQLIGSAFGAAIAGAMFGPVLGGVASYTGTGPAFGTVAALALVLAAAAWATPSAAPTDPQPLRMLFRALTRRKIQIGIWLTLLPALLFGNLSVLAPLRLRLRVRARQHRVGARTGRRVGDRRRPRVGNERRRPVPRTRGRLCSDAARARALQGCARTARGGGRLSRGVRFPSPDRRSA